MGYYPQESLYKPYKYHGYTVRGTPNCPLIFGDPFRETKSGDSFVAPNTDRMKKKSTQMISSSKTFHLEVQSTIWVFPKIGVPQNGWFIMEKPKNPIKMDDLGVPLFLETPIWTLIMINV